MDYQVLIQRYNKYKNFLYIVIPLVIFTFFIVIIQITSTSPQKFTHSKIPPTTTIVTPTPINDTYKYATLKDEASYDPEYSVDQNELGSLEKQETLIDGTTKFTLLSTNLPRKNIVIVAGDELVFRRSVNPINDSQPLEPFLTLYGNPDKIIEGSTYYGNDHKKYIFAKLGFTLIVNSVDRVVEQHFYIPTTPENYLNRFGSEDQ